MRHVSLFDVAHEGLLATAWKTAGASMPDKVEYSLLKLSPFGQHAPPALLNTLSNMLSLVPFSKGEQIPASPFYFVRNGHLNILCARSGDLLSSMHPAEFINWTAEYQTERGMSEAFWNITRTGRRSSYVFRAVTRSLNRLLSVDESIEAYFDWGRFDSRFHGKTWAPLYRLEGGCDGGLVYILSATKLRRLLQSTPAAEKVLRKVASTNLSSSFTFEESDLQRAETARAIDLCASYLSFGPGEKVELPPRIRRPPRFRDSLYLPLEGEIERVFPNLSRSMGAPAVRERQLSPSDDWGGGSPGYIGASPSRQVPPLVQSGPVGLGAASMLVDIDDKCPWANSEEAKHSTGGVVASVRKTDLPRLLDRIPALEHEILMAGKTALLRTYLARVQYPFVDDHQRVSNTAATCTLRRYAARRPVVSQGDEVHDFFIILQGKISITSKVGPSFEMQAARVSAPQQLRQMSPAEPSSDNSVNERLLGPGMAFGEGACLVRCARSDATYATTSEGATLLAMPRKSFERLLSHQLPLLRALYIKLMREKVDLSILLAHPVARSAFAKFFVKHCGNSHALPFFEASSRYAQLGPREAAAARVVGRSIVDDYIRKHAPCGILLNEEGRNSIMNAKCVSTPNFLGDWPPNLFEEAKQEQFNLMCSSLPQFAKSVEFAVAEQRMGTYHAQMLFAHLSPDQLEQVSDGLTKRMSMLVKSQGEAMIMPSISEQDYVSELTCHPDLCA